MAKADIYRAKLATLKNWEPYLLKESGLPGPRGNLELAQVVAEMGTAEQFERWLTLDAQQAPVNSPEEFLAFCGVVGLGRLLAEGQTRRLKMLRRCAADPRWRTREGVAMALQHWGDVAPGALLQAMQSWSQGNYLEQRASAAALCEPRLLKDKAFVRGVLAILDTITASLAVAPDRKSEAFVALRKGLGYCWSVAVAASPAEGRKAMERWFASADKDVRWVMKENLKKNRLAQMDAAWAKTWQGRLG